MKTSALIAVGVVIVSAVLISQTNWHERTHRITRDSHVKLNSEYFLNKDNIGIYTKKWEPKSQPKARIFIVHGLGEHIERYNWVAGKLVDEGFIVYGLDHQGHGKSEGDRTFVSEFNDYAEDVIHYIEKVMKESNDNLPQFLLGHSMGGTISVVVGQKRPDLFKGIVLSGPFFQSSKQFSFIETWLLSTFSYILPKLKLPEKIPPSSVSRCPNTVQSYATDPLVCSDAPYIRTVEQLFSTGSSLLGDSVTLSVPFLIVHGEKDLLAHVNGSIAFHKKAPATDKTCKTYSELYHEVLNEPEKEMVFADILDWINKRV